MKDPTSGRFVLRIQADLHRRLRREADQAGLSLNRFCAKLLDEGTIGNRLALRTAAPEIPEILSSWEDKLEGIFLFGSVAREEAGKSSDVDLLFVLRDGVELSRELYRKWEEESERRSWNRKLSPHFVKLPASESDAGSIWLETAIDGIAIWDRDGKVSAFLSTLRHAIAEGRIRREYSHGHPYWSRAEGAA